jgi:DNA-binding NarL/FixJ family response regulator
LIVDDSERFLEAANVSLDGRELQVVGTATASQQALRDVDESRPDVVLVDISLVEGSSFELTRALVDSYP